MNDKEFKSMLAFSSELTAGSVKTTMKDIGATSADLWKVPAADLHVLPNFNPRIHDDALEAHIEALKASMLANGFLNSKPLEGYVATEDGEQKIYVTDGHCRLAAAKRAIAEGAPISFIPFVNRDRSTTMEDLTVGLVHSNEGKAFTILEKAIIVARLKRFGKTDADIARILGVTSTAINQMATLAGAPKSIRESVQEGSISASLAIEMMLKHKDKAGDKVKATIKAAKAQGKTKATAKDDPERQMLARQKKAAPELFALVDALLKDAKADVPKHHYEPLDALLFKVMGGEDTAGSGDEGDEGDEEV